MGSKKNKVKKALSSSPSQHNNVVDDDLINDLLTELDSRKKTVQEESAAVLEEILTAQTDAVPDKSGSKNRFRARQVRSFHHNHSSMVTSLSSRQGKPLHSLRSSRPPTPKQMRNWNGRPEKRGAQLTRYATN
jgi:hypothetical protein